MNIQAVLRRVCAAAAAACLLVACGSPGGEDGGAAVRRAPSTEPRYGGNVILGSFAEPVLFNELYSRDTVSIDVSRLVFAGLMQVNERLEMEPQIAAAQPEVSDNGTVWTYRLREGVMFHDGVELTAHDVVFTYNVLIHPDYTGPRAGLFRELERVEALDDYMVRFTLSRPDAKLRTLMVVGILPRHLLEQVPVAELGDYREFNVDRPIGAGPYKFVSWTRGQNLVLEAFDDYFEGRPYLDRVTFRYVANQSSGVLLLQTGEIDRFRLPTSELATVERIPHVTVHSTLGLYYEFLGWNLRNPLFADRRVRQALTHAIDRQEIVETLLEGRAEVAHAAVSPLMEWAYSDDVPKFPYDPERARALFAESGWVPGADGILQKEGRRFSFTLLSNDGNVIRRDLSVIVQQYLGAVGIEVRPVQLEWGAYLQRLQQNHDFDAVVGSWALPTDPDPSSIWHSREIERGLNTISFRHPRVDELADRNTTLLDVAERGTVLREIWRIIAEEQPYTFLYYPQQLVGLRSDVRGFTQHPRLETYKMNEWWLDR